MRRILAESANFIITHEFESAFATEKRTGREIALGSHYGDPTCAAIALDESWFAVGGEGVTGVDRRGREFTLLRTERRAPVFIKRLKINSADQLEAVLDDGDDTVAIIAMV
jgi:hypothetical protein